MSNLELIKKNHKAGLLFYPSGEHIAHNFMHPDIRRIIVYRADLKDLSEEAKTAFENNEITYAPIYSARTAAHFCTLIDRHSLQNAVKQVHIVCISAAVTQIFERQGYTNIQTAIKPDHASLMALIEDRINA